MCTVSILRAPFVDGPEGLRWRVAFNRDERLTRGEALLPRAHRHEHVTALYPVDAEGGGTWIAATGAGLVFALLNETDACGSVAQGFSPALEGRPEGLRSTSRGLVVTRLVSSRSIEEAQSRLGESPVEKCRPFRLLVVGEAGLLEAVWAGDLTWRFHEPVARLVRTSSTVAPAATLRKRRSLFDRLVTDASTAAQDAFHAHRWPGDPSASVRMSRPGAATVSVTTIEAFADGFRVSYRPWRAGAPDVTDLPRAA
jgi:hypothetical protein